MIGIFHISFDLICYIFRNSAINLIFIICGRLLSLHSLPSAARYAVDGENRGT